jgi:hypothetical protein
MKYFFYLIIKSCVIISCGDDNSQDPTTDSRFSYEFNGDEIMADGINAYALKDFDEIGSTNVYGISGVGSDRTVLIRVDDTAEINQAFSFDSELYWAAVNDGANSYSSLPVVNGSGTVTITKRNATEIAGTFSFTAFNTDGTGEMFEVSNGSFNVNYRE